MLKLVEGRHELRVELSRSFGTLSVVAVMTGLAMYFALQVTFEWSRSALYFGTLTCMCVLCAWFAWGESEVTVLDRKRNAVRLEKKLPLRSLVLMKLGPLQELMGATIETEPSSKVFQRLVLSFESGLRVPLTDAFLDVRPGVQCGEGAGLKEAKKAIKQFISKHDDGD